MPPDVNPKRPTTYRTPAPSLRDWRRTRKVQRGREPADYWRAVLQRCLRRLDAVSVKHQSLRQAEFVALALTRHWRRILRRAVAAPCCGYAGLRPPQGGMS